MMSFLDTVLTKMVITADASPVIMLWKENGEEIIRIKKEKSERDIEKKTGKRSEKMIEIFMRRIKRTLKDITKNTLERILRSLNATLNIAKDYEKSVLLEEHNVKFVEKKERNWMVIIPIIPNLSTLFGFAKVVTSKFIRINHAKRLSEKTAKAEATVRTFSKEKEKDPKRSFRHYNVVSKLFIAESNRKQCINNDLWVQNLRSTGI